MSISDVFTAGRDREAQASKIYGLVIGIVTNNNDPDKTGKVKVKFPWLSDEVESTWARVVQPMAGNLRGFWFIPEIDDEVLVGFELGDVRRPFVVGSLYNGQDKPPEPSKITKTFAGEGYDHGGYTPTEIQDGKNDLRFVQSRSGHMLVFDDKENAERITIADKTGKHRIEIHTKDKRVVITSEDGDIELIAAKKILLRCEDLVTETRKDTKMTAEGKFLADATGEMKLTTAAKFTAEASGNMKLESTGGTGLLKASQSVTIDGMSVTAKGATSAKVEAPNTTVSGSAMCKISGGMVKIN